MSRIGLAAVLICLAFIPAGEGATGAPAAGSTPELDRWVVRVLIGETADINLVASWIEPWEVHLDQGYLVVDVGAVEHARLLALGLTVEVDHKRSAALRRSLPRPIEGQLEGIPGYPCYRTVEETLVTGAQLALAHPDLATWIDIGDSWQRTQEPEAGYDLRVLRLTNAATTGDKPKLYVEGAIHARELVTAETVTRFAEHLLGGYGVDPDITWLLDHQEVHLLLQTNPDGRKMSEAGEDWRKNTNSTDCGDPSWWGVDLNRNFAFEWNCCGGSSPNGCDNTYHGQFAGSEPETQAVQDYVRSEFPDQRPDDLTTPAPDDAMGIFIDVHSSGEVILSPWSFTADPPPNGDQILRLGRKCGYFNHYEAQLGSVYTVDGSTKDFAYGELGMAGYTWELGTSFYQDCSSFEATVLPDNLDALLYAAKASRAPFMLPAGPDAVDVAVVPSVVAPGEVVQLSAAVDDTRYSGPEPSHVIAGAEAYVNDPPWADGASPMPLIPTDGAFSSPVEDVHGTLDTTGLGTGRHLVYVRGVDVQGSWGPVTAAFLWVMDPATAPRISGTVRSGAGGAPLEATVTAGPFATFTDPVTGQYSMMVVAGIYDVTASAEGHASVTAVGVVATDGTTEVQNFVLPAYATVLDDDVEGGNIGWTAEAPWAITTEASHSPLHSWTDSPGGEYDDDLDISLTSPAIDLSEQLGTELELRHIYELEDGYDYGHIEASPDDGGTWIPIAVFNGTQTSSWDHEVLDLSVLDGAAAARIRFRLETDSSWGEDGWHIDDIVVRAALPVDVSGIFADGFESGDLSAWASTAP